MIRRRYAARPLSATGGRRYAARPLLVAGLGLAGLLGGALWWWAVLRLTLAPDRAGLVEGAVAAGGWGLGLLPVHATAFRSRKAPPGPPNAGAS